jgi:hypothetical protein
MTPRSTIRILWKAHLICQILCFIFHKLIPFHDVAPEPVQDHTTNAICPGLYSRDYMPRTICPGLYARDYMVQFMYRKSVIICAVDLGQIQPNTLAVLLFVIWVAYLRSKFGDTWIVECPGVSHISIRYPCVSSWCILESSFACLQCSWVSCTLLVFCV